MLTKLTMSFSRGCKIHPLLLLIPVFAIFVCTLPTPALPLSFNYSSMGNSTAENYLIYKGNVSFTPDYVDLSWLGNQITPTQSAGRIYNRDELALWNPATQIAASFNCSFTLSIVPINGTTPADGLAFFLLDPAHSEITATAKASNLGLPLSYTTVNTGVVGVEFDTYLNPDVDHSSNHIGIDINSIISAKYSNLSFVLIESSLVFSWVDYSSSQALLEVYATNLSSTKPPSPLFSYTINLTQILPWNVLIGFSAGTGGAAEYHRIHSWSFNSTSIGISAPTAPGVVSAPAPAPQVPPITAVPTETMTKKGSHTSLIAGLIATGTLVGVIIPVLFLLLKRWRRRRQRHAHVPLLTGIHLSGLPSPSDVDQGPQMFNYRDLSAATNNFSEDCLLGEGGFGSVYKGVLPNGSEIAVKCISQKSTQGEKEFFAEVSIISQIRHKNLVHLKGWCRHKSKLLLVYEYLSNGNLHRTLFSKTSTFILDWSKRYNIMCGLGAALQYLHEGCNWVIVHRDVKASNVMLDADYHAKLGDFGLARQFREGVEGHTTLAAGTLGYMAPETFRTGRATTMSDVYSYGMVLLVVGCGRRPVDDTLPTIPGQFDGYLLDWVWDLHSKGVLAEACDCRLQGDFDEEQLLRTLTVGLACLHPDPKMRPPIQVAVEALQGRSPLPVLPTVKPVISYGYPPSQSTSLDSSCSTLPTSISSLSSGM